MVGALCWAATVLLRLWICPRLLVDMVSGSTGITLSRGTFYGSVLGKVSVFAI